MSLSGLIILAVAVMLCLAMGIVFFVFLYQRRVINHQIEIKEFNRLKQEELLQASIQSEEEERMRIAGELHDDVGATLSSIRLFLYKAARNPSDVSVINQSKELLDESIQKIRNLSHQLQPSTLQYLGLPKSLQSLAEMITKSGGIEVSFVEDASWRAVDTKIELALYRVIQELINNILKHAAARKVQIRTCEQQRQSCIELTHNGNGLTDETYQELLYKKGAIGLKNIENRLKSANAGIAFARRADGLFTIQLTLLPNN